MLEKARNNDRNVFFFFYYYQTYSCTTPRTHARLGIAVTYVYVYVDDMIWSGGWPDSIG